MKILAVVLLACERLSTFCVRAHGLGWIYSARENMLPRCWVFVYCKHPYFSEPYIHAGFANGFCALIKQACYIYDCDL